jgi:hypothetical protein
MKKYLMLPLLYIAFYGCSANWPGPDDGYSDIDYFCTGLESKCNGNNFMWCNNGSFTIIDCESKGNICVNGIGCTNETNNDQDAVPLFDEDNETTEEFDDDMSNDNI